MKLNMCNQNAERKGISLKCFGINEKAWTFNDVMDLLDKLQTNNCIVLGGDVYKIEDSTIKITYDSWYYDKVTDDDVYNSVKEAREYIYRYCKMNKGNFAFSIVFKKNEN